MTMASSMGVQRLPLHDQHAQKAARFGHFGQWEVPLYYTTILEEHEAVRRRAGLFDVSHMGKFRFEGKSTADFLDQILPRNIKKMWNGQALYMPLSNEHGGFVDDIILYQVSPSIFYMIVNAGNVEKDYEWIQSRLRTDIRFENLTAQMGLLALQGPASAQILSRALPNEKFSSLSYYSFKEWNGGMIARTGYTGEDGFEIMLSVEDAPAFWNQLFSAGKDFGLVPAGFGARDTLRLEAGMLLYGHDMNDDVTPLEAGIEWAIDLSKESFTGKEALEAQKKEGIKRRLIGFEMIERGIPRQDYEIQKNGRLIGKVTSGTFAPTLKSNIGMGIISAEEAVPGNDIEVIIREKPLKAKIVKLPFYKRRK